jgi:hypothetical protein
LLREVHIQIQIQILMYTGEAPQTLLDQNEN